MNCRSWFAKREVKKVKKLKRELSFLNEMMNSNYIQLLEEMQRNENEINVSLSKLKKEIKDITISGQQHQEKVEESLNKLENAACCVEKDLEKITSMLSVLQKNVKVVQKGIDSNNTILEDNSKEILQSTGEVKELMKIVAINNLLDEF